MPLKRLFKPHKIFSRYILLTVRRNRVHEARSLPRPLLEQILYTPEQVGRISVFAARLPRQ
jgi:hypothetical protein